MSQTVQSPTFAGSRKHPRAQLNLPVRLRWPGTQGTKLERTHTIDVSREGLLVQRAEPCEVQTRVWVVFPFGPQQASAQPETPATVVRVERDCVGGFHVALRLESVVRPDPRPPVLERRKHVRIPITLPIFVRKAGTPLAQESMTQNISRSGVRFETSQIYEPGEEVLGKIPWGEWAEAGELSGRVLRVDCPGHPEDGSLSAAGILDRRSTLRRVAVQWKVLPESSAENS
jgi:hypothetical protein